MEQGPTPGKTFALISEELYIGRDISNDIVINDAEISRKHVRLTFQADQYVMEDLGSTNGTFVDGQRITGPHILTSGNKIMMGENVLLEFSALQDPDATIAVPHMQAVQLPTAESPPPAAPAPQQPAYVPQTPASVEEPAPPEDEGEGPNTTWILAGCGCLVLVGCVAIIAALFYIDANNLWCDVLPFLANCP